MEEDDGDDKPEKDADEPAKPEPEVKPVPGGSGDFLKKKRLGKIEYFICST